ncbi:rho guanine nucleotide exchange factor 11-like isoform X5 [Saccostrea echinata]|uniref:rho guanine nucleotide exchange factor 11-like isoform X5 n=1 Tax=Saccostrea echinata TaxID=191078 RepID=UPI002A811EE6|nr:rho guanine nucleotide exchange factor 11-like isoform X5 [Saccostrea echinata]
MPLGKKWRSMDVLHFGSSKQDKEALKKDDGLIGSGEHLSRTCNAHVKGGSRDDLINEDPPVILRKKHSSKHRFSSREDLLDKPASPKLRQSLHVPWHRAKSSSRDDLITNECRKDVNDRHSSSVKGEQHGTQEETKEGYIQRCVIIQRDEKGYGLTVRGDNPVYVESVKTDGAAERAGVRQGDRICKVNGTLVTNSNHLEVVKLIKAGSFVALTLMNKAPEKVTKPIPVDSRKSAELQASKLSEIKKYYDNATEELQRTRTQLQNNPADDKLASKVKEQEVLVKKLEDQLKVLSSTLNSSQNNAQAAEESSPDIGNGDGSVTPWLPDGPKHKKSGSTPIDFTPDTRELRAISRSMSDASSRVMFRKPAPVQKRQPGDISPEGTTGPVSDGSSVSDSPNTSPPPSPTPTHPNNLEDTQSVHKKDLEYDEVSQTSQASIGQQQMPIIAAEEDEFNSDEDMQNKVPVNGRSSSLTTAYLNARSQAELDDCGPFSSLHQLETKPAHMSVFLNFVLQNESPSALLFYITTNVYQQAKGGIKELQKWAFEIFSTFLANGAPLKVNVDQGLVERINETFNSKSSEKEDILRTVFNGARNFVQTEISNSLQGFCSKLGLGFGTMYGLQLITGISNMRQKEEAEVALQILSSYIDKVPQSDEESKPDQSHAIAWAVATFLRHNGIMDKKHSSMERVQSFMAKDKKKPLIQRKRTQKGHSFQPQHFSRVENCIHCRELIWGVGIQGYQCSNCEQWIHKYCLDSLEDQCPKKKRPRPHSSVFNIPRPQADRHSSSSIEQMLSRSVFHVPLALTVPSTSEAPSPSPANPTTFNIQPFKDEREEDKVTPMHSVNSLIKRYDNGNPDAPSDRKKSPSVEDMANKKSTEISRSESLKGRQDQKGRIKQRRVKSDVEIDDNMMRTITGNSPSSSSSSIRSGESPSSSMDAVNNIPHTIENDSDFEVENELPPLESIYPRDVYKKLRPKDRKRLEVINELFYTERTHCRNLKILQNLFYKPMSQDPNISQDLINTLFPNLEEMIALHGLMNSAMKERKKQSSVVTEVGDILLARFDTEGEAFRNGCAKFCQNQQYALDLLRAKQRKDSKLSNFLMEAESSPLMRRLQLRDLIPTQMMRLTKYPLLIENLMKYTQTSTEEYSRLERALKLSKQILAYVNQAVKDCENSYKLKMLQRKIDKKQLDHAEFKELDLSKHKLMLDGALTWNINQRKSVDCHVVLLEDLLVLFQKQDDKLVLKQQSTQLVAGKEDSRYQFSPLLRLENVLHTNSKATDKKAFFVVSKTQIYELSATSTEEQKKWIRHIKEAAETFKKRKDKAQEPAQVHELAVEPPQIIRRPSAERQEEDLEEELIQPDEITVQNPLTQKAEPVLTPLEKIRRLDETLQEHLQEKTVLVAEVLNIPTAEVPQRLQMVEEMPENANTSDNLLALSRETQNCLVLLNNAESGLAEEDLKMPIPMEKLREMANRMNQILTNLLAVVNSRDEERERLRLELKAAQEELNMLREIQRRVSGSNTAALAPVQGRPQSFISDASSYSDNEVVANTEDEDMPDVHSDHNEVDVDTGDVPDDLDVDPETAESEVSHPTNLPKEITDIDVQSLTEIEPPLEEFMEEPEPLSVPEDILTGGEDTEKVTAESGVQKAEINLIEEFSEEVTEFPSNQKDVVHSEESEETECKDTTKEEQSAADVPPTENSCEDPGGLSEEIKTSVDEERRFSNDDYEDALETQSEIRESSEERTNEKLQEEITDQEKTDVGKEGAESDPETADKETNGVSENSEKSQIIEDKLSEKSEEKILDNEDNENNLESTNTTDNREDSGSPV